MSYSVRLSWPGLRPYVDSSTRIRSSSIISGARAQAKLGAFRAFNSPQSSQFGSYSLLRSDTTVNKSLSVEDTREASIMKPVYGFNPVESRDFALQTPPVRRGFLSLLASSWENANIIKPELLGIPWLSSFPGCAQSAHHGEIVRSGQNYLASLLAGRAEGKQLVNQKVETVASFVVHLFPTGELERMKTLMKCYLLIFMQDDSKKVAAFRKLLSEQLDSRYPADSHLILNWVDDYFSTQRPSQCLDHLGRYLAYRVHDVGADVIFRSIRFACEANLSNAQWNETDRLRALCSKHFALVNDLYSYRKEVEESRVHNTPLINAVKVLETIRGIAPSVAQAAVCDLIWEIEGQIETEATAVKQGGMIVSSAQQQFIGEIILAMAGNVFYSATCHRYARFHPGSRL
ncbi:hypothetical protein ASPZODRAFT_162617 [Penicilliopsis zonata CBS 506.65]|uniref:Terpene synthase n=1 Tax=Penicilliopsis zonata CBS 506.65 TaxID=1073090 RepID=A0A1L9SU64_9EURO|nr:hypothetical protein ASPZODRAFT_162617 [Penicilliopsis zonata CBS 506.65]OJJ50676.1 hypothetical protein ASPZODRAFT_162617 [Penicilliopsis zonata CBS 506.65]